MNEIVKSSKELTLKELPIKVFFDEDRNCIVFQSDYNLEFRSNGAITTIAKGNCTIIGEEIHLNPII